MKTSTRPKHDEELNALFRNAQQAIRRSKELIQRTQELQASRESYSRKMMLAQEGAKSASARVGRTI